MEVKLAETLRFDAVPRALAFGHRSSADNVPAIEAALQLRADHIAQVLALPPDMPIRVHYVDSDVVNAVATLGGHLTVFRGLLTKLRYEEELDGVLAHEIGHIQHRHMIRHLSRGVSLAMALGVVGVRSTSLTKWLIGDAQQLEQLAYTREAEREADATAALASQRLYGHTQGLVGLFALFECLQREQDRPGRQLGWLQSHPLPAERAAQARAASNGNGVMQPLKGALRVGEAAACGA